MPPTLSRKESIAIGIWTTLGLIAALLCTRQLSGDFHGPLPAEWIVAWTAIVSSLSAAAWWLIPDQQQPRAAAIAVGIAFITSWAGSPGLNAGTTGLMLGCWCLAALALWSNSHGEEVWAFVLTQTETTDGKSNCEPVANDSAEPQESVEADNANQTMVRRVVDGQEIIEGTVRIAFAAGQRETMVHLSFCPPLVATPDVELDDPDGHGWELKVAAAYPFGLRLQIRRGRETAAEVTGCIAYWAASTAASRAA